MKEKEERYMRSEKGKLASERSREMAWLVYQAHTNKQKYYNTLVRLAIYKHKIILKD